jgi:uncharacterized protein (TIGR00730 family)
MREEREGPTGSASKRQQVLVYCASSSSCDAAYHRAAARLGALLAHASMGVVYGGGASGSMGALADAALAAGGEVVGIVPGFMRDLEWSHDRLSALHVVDDMQERKRRMLAQADALVTLPGGSGTFEELFESISAKRLGIYLNPIVIVNQRGFFDPCIEMLDRCIDQRFMDPRHRTMWSVVEDVEEVLDAIAASPDWSEDARSFAAV